MTLIYSILFGSAAKRKEIHADTATVTFSAHPGYDPFLLVDSSESDIEEAVPEQIVENTNQSPSFI